MNTAQKNNHYEVAKKLMVHKLVFSYIFFAVNDVITDLCRCIRNLIVRTRIQVIYSAEKC